MGIVRVKDKLILPIPTVKQSARIGMVTLARCSRRKVMMLVMARGIGTLFLLPLALGKLSLAGAVPEFERDVLPILTAKCAACHAGPQAQGQLDLQRGPSLLRGSKHGTVVTPGSAAESKLFQKIKTRQMPPPGAGMDLQRYLQAAG